MRKGMISRVALVAGLCASSSAGAQTAEADANMIAAPDQNEEIIVTARKREESQIDVPVAITAVTGAELSRRGVSSIDGLARLVPQLIVGEGGGVQGGNIVMRGISGADANPFADQAVSFNIDGVQVARATVRRMSQMDVQQIEVLKGPQALFFGKNSPGGVISIRTADPTRDFAGKVSIGYETEAHEWRGEGFVSGPITDDLGFRLAVYGAKMRGWVENITPRSEIAAPRHRFAPRSEEYGIRATFKYEPSDSYNARLKFNFGELRNDSFTSNVQFLYCPLGTPQAGGVDDCKADDKVSVGAARPNFGRRDPAFGRNDGELDGYQRQALASLEQNLKLSDALTLTSVTGFYDLKERNLVNVTSTYITSRIFPVNPRLQFKELSEELRLTSDFSGPLNFMLGVHLQRSTAKTGSTGLVNGTAFTTTPPLVPTPLINYYYEQKGQAYSAFMQMQWDVSDQLEVSVGGRYSYEKKKLPVIRSGTAIDPVSGVLLPPTPLTVARNRNSWQDFSPEVTIAYRPMSNLNIYGTYKHGFISGGFNAGTGGVTGALDYDQQTVKGFEAGVKGEFFNGRLSTNLSVYTYEIKGLQVSVLTLGFLQELKNVGKVRSKGGEFDFNYRTPIDGLSLRGAIAFNKARYVEFYANCYRGQSKALGCAFVPVAGQPGVGSPAPVGVSGALQNLEGVELVRAPRWSGNLGFNYDVALSDGLKLGLSSGINFSSSYFTDITSNPNGRVPNYQLIDAGLRLSDVDDKWEVALIGRNLTDKFYWVRAVDSPLTGTAPGNETGPTLGGDLQSPVSRGREVMLRVSTRF